MVEKEQFFVTLMKKKDWMSRVHVTSKRRSIPSERVDSGKHKNRPGLGCSYVGLKIVEIGQFFITLEEEGPDEMNSCREYTLPRSEEASRVRGWILGNTKIDPVLDLKLCLHQKRYGIEIMVESLFRDRTVSWVRIVNGIDKYVTETSETIS